MVTSSTRTQAFFLKETNTFMLPWIGVVTVDRRWNGRPLEEFPLSLRTRTPFGN